MPPCTFFKPDFILRKIVETSLPKYFAFFEGRLTQSGSGFLVGDSISIADLALFVLTNQLASGKLDGIPTDVISTTYPACTSHNANVASHAKVVEWYSTHK